MVFIETSYFTKLVSEYLDDVYYARFRQMLVTSPDAGDVIRGTGGVRKVRCRLPGKGKRSGLRVIYYWHTPEDQILLLTLYAKGDVTDLTPAEKKALKQLTEEFKMAKRNLFEELSQGLEEAIAHKKGKVTLRTTDVQPAPLPKMTPEAVRAVREKMNVSRAVFAHSIRVHPRTLENWEQGKSKVPDSAAALILMCASYPDTMDRLATL